MAFSSAFHERLHQMDCTRIQRLSLLQAEKESQADKSRALASKLANIRASEQRCSWLDHKIASQNFKLLALKCQIENLEAKHDSLSLQLRSLQNEVEELEELRDTRESFYEAKKIEMRKFKEIAESFVVNCRTEVESLRNRVNLLKSSFMELKSNSGNSCNSEITAAEMRRLELQAEKDNVCRIIDCNHQIKAQLQKQLQIILMTQTQGMSTSKRVKTMGNKRKEPERPGRFYYPRFLSKKHEEHYATVQERCLLMERKAMYIPDLVPEFQLEIERQGWERLTTYPALASVELVKEFCTNALPRGRVSAGIYMIYVRGQLVRYDPDTIHTFLGTKWPGE